MHFRHVRESDYTLVISVIDEWWDGRQMADMLPKLFFQHFQDTSFIVENDHEMIGFLIGFVSQTHPQQAYIHFIGVHPGYRKAKVAKRLYERFFDKVKESGCEVVRCITSPVNKTSVAFHTHMGFEIEKGNREVEGVSVFVDYDGKGNDRVLFVKKLR